MTDPDRAVDGDPATAWRANGGGRMVVDLGREHPLGRVALRWTPGAVAPVEVAVSSDGLDYAPRSPYPTAANGRSRSMSATSAAATWRSGRGRAALGAAALAELGVFEVAGRAEAPRP